MDAIFRAHSRAYRHDHRRGLLLLDVDLTGLPCGKSAEEARKGYLSGYGVRRGRQMGRVMASAYDEVVADRVRHWRIDKLVVDPVMIAKSGDRLLREDAVKALVEELLPLATYDEGACLFTMGQHGSARARFDAVRHLATPPHHRSTIARRSCSRALPRTRTVRWLSAWTFAWRAVRALARPGADPRHHLRQARAALQPSRGQGLADAADELNRWLAAGEPSGRR